MSFKTYAGIMAAILILAIGISVTSIDLFAEAVQSEQIQENPVTKEDVPLMAEILKEAAKEKEGQDPSLPDTWFIVTDGEGHYKFGFENWTDSSTYDSYDDAFERAMSLYEYLQEKKRAKALVWEKVNE